MKHFTNFMMRVCIGLLVVGLFQNSVAAQSGTQKARSLSGIVLDINGAPMLGVAVTVVGTTTGVITDVEGKYKIELPAGNQTVNFTYVGYQTVEELITTQTSVNVVMREASESIDDVVVVGYGKQKQVSVTGSISTVKAAELQTVAVPSLSNTLGGFVPGVTTRQTVGEPGWDQAQVFIRGMGTFNNRSPLILVDGVERDLNTINTEEIETVSTLKDASATAVYGVRGANGVIMITTKRGKMGKPEVTFRTEHALLSGLRFPEYVNGYEFASLMNEAADNTGNARRWKPEELQKFADHSDPYVYPDMNWTDMILKRHSYQSINNLNISGGNEMVRYYVNLGYTYQEGLYNTDPKYRYNTNSAINRYNFRSNIDVNLSKNLIVELGIGGHVQTGNYPGNGSGAIFQYMREISPISFPVYNPNGSLGGGLSGQMNNPWGIATQSGYATQIRNVFQTNLGIKWDLSDLVTKGLSLNGRASYDYFYFNEIKRNKAFEVQQYSRDAQGNDVYNVIRPETPMAFIPFNDSNRALYWEGSLNYDRAFGKHQVGAMFVFNRRDYAVITAGNSVANLPFLRQGMAARVTYGYDSRYLFEFNAGYNGSENFPKGKRYGFFPSVSAGWVVTNEKFWHADWMSNLKLRASFGLVGNDQVGGERFLYMSTVNTGGAGYHFGYPIHFEGGMAEGRIATNVGWEVAKKINIGVDLGFFKDRLTIMAEYWRERREDILLKRQKVPDYGGFMDEAIPYGNLGIVKNHGVDAMIQFRNTTKSGIYYSIDANIGFARNKLIENDEPNKAYPYLSAKGHQMDPYWGLTSLGFFQSYEEIEESPTQTFQSIVRPGDIKYADINGDGVVDDYDVSVIGYARTPEIMFGFGGTIAYKGFDLSVHFTGATNVSTMFDGPSMWPYSLEFPNFNILKEYYDNRYIPTPDADNSKAKYPAVIDGQNPNNYRGSTTYLRDASYIRLKSAEIGYNFPQAWMKRMKISGIRVFVNGSNLFCIDKLKFIDPEADNTGGYPLQRVINLGVQVKF